jgi:hypothetical protein
MMSRLIARLLLLLAGLLVATAPARADIFKLGNFGFVAGDAPGSYQLTVQLPQSSINRAAPIWPSGCTQTGSDRQSSGSEAQLSFEIRCTRPISRNDIIRTPWTLDGATFVSNVTGAQVSRSLQPADQGMILPIGETSAAARAFSTVFQDYVWQGIFHILGGWDHLAFVLCLCLLTRGRTLLWLVTAFTAGHSLSLALAFFGVIHVPAPPVEAVIALSIAFMAREALRAKNHDGHEAPADWKRYMIVVASFGLLHGLGFASALNELGVAPGERIVGLVAFNVGVECGQLLFVAAVSFVMGLAARIHLAQPVRVAALYGAGALGCFWMIERVAGFGTPLA